MKPMSPEKFLDEINEIYPEAGYDEEIAHQTADMLMEQILWDMGYSQGIEKLREKTRWYA